MNTQISIYENAKHWIAQYESVDEVKEYRDKAIAVQEYAKRANDYEMEIQAAKARVRAERRCGELLKETEKAKGGWETRGTTEVPQDKIPTLSDMGLSKNQSSKWQQLANVPEDEFEESLAEPAAIPSAHAILQSRKPKPPKNIDEAWIESEQKKNRLMSISDRFKDSVNSTAGFNSKDEIQEIINAQSDSIMGSVVSRYFPDGIESFIEEHRERYINAAKQFIEFMEGEQ